MQFTKQPQTDVWFDETGQYRISETHYKDRILYYACYRARNDHGVYWDTAGPSKPYRSFKAAERAANQHALFWTRILSVTELGPKRRDARFEWVMEKRFMGRGKNRVSIAATIPVYMHDKLDDFLRGKLIPRKRKKGRK